MDENRRQTQEMEESKLKVLENETENANITKMKKIE